MSFHLTRQIKTKINLLGFFKLKSFIFVILLGGFLCNRALAEEQSFDMDVEETAALADSEGAMMAADESRRRAEDEKMRLEQESKLAAKEAERARKLEAEAKTKLANYQEQEARLKKERIEAEKRTSISREKIKGIEQDLAAREMEINALRELTEKAVVERDSVETELNTTRDRLQQLKTSIELEKKKQSSLGRQIDNSKKALAREQRNLAKFTRLPAQSQNSGAKREGWVRIRRNCPAHQQADEGSKQIKQINSGQKIYGKIVNPNWIMIKGKNWSGYINKICLK